MGRHSRLVSLQRLLLFGPAWSSSYFRRVDISPDKGTPEHLSPWEILVRKILVEK